MALNRHGPDWEAFCGMFSEFVFTTIWASHDKFPMIARDDYPAFAAVLYEVLPAALSQVPSSRCSKMLLNCFLAGLATRVDLGPPDPVIPED